MTWPICSNSIPKKCGHGNCNIHFNMTHNVQKSYCSKFPDGLLILKDRRQMYGCFIWSCLIQGICCSNYTPLSGESFKDTCCHLTPPTKLQTLSAILTWWYYQIYSLYKLHISFDSVFLLFSDFYPRLISVIGETNIPTRHPHPQDTHPHPHQPNLVV